MLLADSSFDTSYNMGINKALDKMTHALLPKIVHKSNATVGPPLTQPPTHPPFTNHRSPLFTLLPSSAQSCAPPHLLSLKRPSPACCIFCERRNRR